MIAAFWLIVAAEAATRCPPADAPRLGGGALFVRPVGMVDKAPFIGLGPATGIEPKPGLRRTDAETAGEEAARPAKRCEPFIEQV